VAELIVWANDRRRAAIPDPYEGLADDEASPIDMGEAEPGPRARSDLN
jgi:sec-independent protein translocase protein TatC